MRKWALVVPVKRLEKAKTRLAGALPAVPHAELVLAITLDTLAAAVACPAVGRVVVVSDDPAARRAVLTLGPGVLVVGDEPDAGLNEALEHGARLAAALPAAGVATLSADLPALSPIELAAALDAAAWHPRAFVPDAAGTGTTLLTARTGTPLLPAYGTGSAAAHARWGPPSSPVTGPVCAGTSTPPPTWPPPPGWGWAGGRPCWPVPTRLRRRQGADRLAGQVVPAGSAVTW